MKVRNWLRACTLLCAGWLLPAAAQPLQAGGSEWRPFSYTDGQGMPRGISVEVTREAMARCGLQVDFLFYPANRLNALLKKGQLDLNYADSPLWNDASAAADFVYSIPYLQVHEHLYFLADHPARDLPLERLGGLNIGMVRGYVYQTLEPALDEGRLRKVETSYNEVLLELLRLRRVDAVAMVDELFEHQVASQGLEAARFVRGAQLSDAPLGLRLQRRHAEHLPALNAALRQLLESGEVERIRRRYLPGAREATLGS